MSAPKRVHIDPLGESAYILRDLGDTPPRALADALFRSGRVLEAVPSYETVGVYVRERLSESELRQILESVTIEPADRYRTLEIPVCYSINLDLDAVARRLGLTVDEVVSLHSQSTYVCHAIGFAPGFPFLGYLPEALQGIPRRESPRPRVPAGSVGITGKQTGVYPAQSPGGWAIIGTTPLSLADLDDAYFPISTGDRIRFVPIGEAEFEARRGERL